MFAAVEAEGAGIAAIGQYLETIISAFEKSDCPSNGCLVPNTLAQLEPDDTETRKLLEEHFKRQEDGIRTAITNENKAQKHLGKKEIDALAKFVTISVQGLATRFRMAPDAKPLRQFARTLIQILEAQVHDDS
ncbi:TetR family transcriptional regulator C-terminal domain-containing protein [Adhaeretor mobilis]|nr:TetR family transcriptional regulator C-terminal domain-containing protein [Adhaeretor mobilis]